MLLHIFRILKRDGKYIADPFTKFKIYRWWMRGKWAFIDGHWLRAGKDDYLFDAVGRHYGCHYTYKGVQKREEYV